MNGTDIGELPDEALRAALAGRYEFERAVGRGGMATVFLATDVERSRPVAIKVLHPDLTAALGAARFRREVEIERALDHPGILGVIEAGEAAGYLYYVMPFVRGESLRTRLQREGQLPVDEAISITAQVARALAYAHERGIVHRDVKPENILLDEGRPIVADFGIARALRREDEQRLTQTGVTLGTPTYMSPEQSAAERTIDGRSDLYSLGCVLYEMLAGQPPFTGPNAQAVFARHMMEAVPSITVVRPSVSDEVEDVVLRALAKSPVDRFPNMAAMADALEQLLATGHTTVMRTVATPRSLDRHRPRRRWPVALAAAGVLAAAAIGASAAWSARRQPVIEPENARRIAVLDFVDASPDGSLGYLAEGLADDLREELARIAALDVRSRAATLPFLADSTVSLDSLGRALDVGLVVRGTVAPRGDSARVLVDLVAPDANESSVLERPVAFTVPLAQATALRDSLADEVVTFLRAQIGSEVTRRDSRAAAGSDAAWLVLQRAHASRRRADERWRQGDSVGTRRMLREADSLAAHAAAMDRAWADPVVVRGEIAYRQAELVGEVPAAAPWLDSALALAAEALRRDARHAAALELRGAARYARVRSGLAANDDEVRRLAESAAADLEAAVRADPARASALVKLSEVYYQLLRRQDALRAAERALEADAYLESAPFITYRLFATNYDLGQPEAEDWCARGVARYPQMPQMLRCRILLMTMRGARVNVDSAWAIAARLQELHAPAERPYWNSFDRILIAAALGRAGMVDSARAVLATTPMDASVDPRGELQGLEAFAVATIGDRERAIALLERYLRAYPEHREGFRRLNTWWWEGLRGDPRFEALVGG